MDEKSILIVEDARVIAYDLKQAVENLGYSVAAVVSSGEAAIDKATEVQPDLVLMDIVLKGEMDGIDAAHEIRERCDVPVIFLTAFADEATLQRAKSIEPFGYILKPFVETELNASIQMALYKHQMEQQLRESERRYRRIVETSYEGIYTVDAQNNITFANDRMAVLLGYTVDEILGQALSNFMDEAGRSALDERVDRHRRGISEGYELHFLKKDGSDLWAIASATPNFDQTGQYVGALAMITDITADKKAEERLQESEMKYRDLVENVSDVIYHVDKDGLLTYVSPAVESSLGYHPSEVIGRLFSEWIYPEDIPRIREGFRTLLSGSTVTNEYRVFPKSGELRWIRTSSRPVMVGDVVVGVHGVLVDITQRKQAEEALQESEERYRALFDQSQDAILLENAQEEILDANPAATQLFGFSREELLTMTTRDLQPPDIQERPPRPIYVESALSDGDRFETEVQNRSGARIPAEISVTSLSAGQSSFFLSNVRDISERKVAEQALQQRNRDLAMLNQVSQALITLIDLPRILEQLLAAAVKIADAEGSSVWLWNEGQAAELMCRAILHQGEFRTPHDLCLGPGQGIAGWVAQKGESTVVSNVQDDPRFYSGVDDKIDFRTTSLLAVPLKMRDHVHGVLEVVNKQEGVTGAPSVGFDADDRVLVEMLAASAAIAIDNARLIEALRRYGMELEARNQDLDAFAHTVAHDLKNPLANMVGYAEVLEEDAVVLPAEDVRGYLRLIAQRGRKMTNIIDELLLLAGVRQIERMELTVLEMAGVVADAQNRLADLIAEHHAEIIVPETWPKALGHGPWVEEVWVNYLSNAIKYGGQPPRAELGAEEQPDGFVRFWVRDNGPGLTLEERTRLFTSFERLHQVRAKGHGLGLSIARRIVEKLGGEVGVESKVGQGSTFFFTLPTAKR